MYYALQGSQKINQCSSMGRRRGLFKYKNNDGAIEAFKVYD